MRKNEKITALCERLSRDDFGKDDDQQRESNSISNQKAMLEEFAARQGFTNIVHFTDDGISGTCFDRPGFLAMMKEVEAGNVEYLCIKDMSRMGRDYLKVGQIMEILRQRGVRLIAINDGVDSARGDDDFTPFRNIMNAFYPVEHTGHDSGLAIAQAGVQPAGSGVFLVGVHAEHRAAVVFRVAFIVRNKGGAVAPPRPKRVHHKGVKHHHFIRLSVVKPAHLCVYRHLYTVDYGGGSDLPAVHADKKVAPPERVQRGLAGGVYAPLPAYCKMALLLCIDYAAVYGSDGINVPGCGFYELHIRIPCLRSLRERWA